MRLKVRRLDSHFIEALGVKGLSLIVEPHFCGVNKMLWNCSCVEGLTKVSRQSPFEWQNSAILSIEHFASSLTHGVKCENLLSLSVCLKNHSVLGTIDWNEANYFFLQCVWLRCDILGEVSPVQLYFIQKRFIVHILCTRHYGRCWWWVQK